MHRREVEFLDLVGRRALPLRDSLEAARARLGRKSPGPDRGRRRGQEDPLARRAPRAQPVGQGRPRRPALAVPRKTEQVRDGVVVLGRGQREGRGACRGVRFGRRTRPLLSEAGRAEQDCEGEGSGGLHRWWGEAVSKRVSPLARPRPGTAREPTGCDCRAHRNAVGPSRPGPHRCGVRVARSLRSRGRQALRGGKKGACNRRASALRCGFASCKHRGGAWSRESRNSTPVVVVAVVVVAVRVEFEASWRSLFWGAGLGRRVEQCERLRHS